MSEKIALVVDDTPANRDFLERLLALATFSVRGASSGEAALSIAAGLDKLALAVIDMKLPDMDGLKLTCDLRAKFPDVCIVVATMYDERSLMEEAFSKGCDVFLVKPNGFMELFQRLMTRDLKQMRERLVIDQYGPRPYSVALV
jgi:CheY-like chemotaxis protein